MVDLAVHSFDKMLGAGVREFALDAFLEYFAVFLIRVAMGNAPSEAGVEPFFRHCFLGEPHSSLLGD